MHSCPLSVGSVPHVGGPLVQGCATVLIENQPAARVGDVATCTGPPDMVASGSSNVIIGYLPAARLGDPTAHGGIIAAGAPTVLIGANAQAQALVVAARHGTPLCEVCED